MSFWLNTKRIARYGLVGFFRNGFVSLAAIIIMVITLFVIASLMIGSAALSATLDQLTEKVDVNVYFVTAATEEQVVDVKERIEALPDVASVAYISREQALENFRERHKNDQLTIQGLEELDENPLGASLAVRAKDTSKYEGIASFLESLPSATGTGEDRIIEKINFSQHKDAIDRLTSIIDASRRTGLAIALFLAITSVLIAFNTIRLAIYTARDEITVMRLVGAGAWYVRGPFVFSGILYGLTAAIVVLVSFYPIAWYLAEPSERYFGNFNTLTYAIEHLPLIVVTILGTGILLGAVSSYLAVHRYLKH